MSDEQIDKGLVDWALNDGKEAFSSRDGGPVREEKGEEIPDPKDNVGEDISEDKQEIPPSEEDTSELNEEEDTAPEEIEKPKAKEKSQKGKKVDDWVKHQLREEREKRQEAQQAAEKAIAEARAVKEWLAALQRGEEIPNQGGENVPNGYVPQSEVLSMAAELSRRKSFDEHSNAVYNAGVAEYEDFQDAVDNLRLVGVISQNRTDFQQLALDTDNPQDVLYFLGNNPSEAKKIDAFLRQGNAPKAAAELTKISMKVASDKMPAATKQMSKVSKAPAPIKPIVGHASQEVDWLNAADPDVFYAGFEKIARKKGLL